ncbi:SU10 major capsid protein [Guptibacillus hwajinpoensis]|uniref:SU10 major capsid protein n=1 Tax=Guptibacillus hwajinpoensis TaxID=208199 RepID=UPI0037367ABF
MFQSSNFTKSEQVNLSKEIALIGVESTPLTSMLMAKGKIEKALSTVYSFREKTIDNTDDISAVEGADTTEFYESARAELSNVLEIFKKGASLSGTATAMKSTQFAEEINDRLFELKINIEKKLINGVKADGSQAPFKRQMAGLIESADAANAVSVTGTIAEADIKQQMRNLWNQNLVEGEYFAFVNADLKEQIDAIYADKVNYNAPVSKFGVLVQQIVTNYGTMNIVLSKHVPADKVVTFNDAYLALAHLREPHFEPLSKTGDSVKGQVIAETTLKVGSPKSVSVLTVA